MQCPRCGNVPAQGDVFCGNCGFQLGDNLPTVLSQRQAPTFHSAPTVVATTFNAKRVQAAMMALDNPYHSLLPRLTMPKLVLNDDKERVWAVERQGSERIAWYEKNGDLRIRRSVKGGNTVFPLIPIQIADFTFQAGIVFHRSGLDHDERFPTFTVDANVIEHQWGVAPIAGKLRVFLSRVPYTLPNHWDEEIPPYEPFLLGIVRYTISGHRRYAVLINLKIVGLDTELGDTFDLGDIRLRVDDHTDVSVQHTKLWVP